MPTIESHKVSLVLSSVFRTANIKSDNEDFKSKIKKEAEIKSPNEFLFVIRRLLKLADIKPITDICLFKTGIAPMWEDKENIKGGKWFIKTKRNKQEQRIFERMMIWMALIPFKTMEVNGIVISIRGHQIIFSLWIKSRPSPKEVAAQEQEIRSILDLKDTNHVTFKGNDESLKDISSFKVPATKDKLSTEDSTESTMVTESTKQKKRSDPVPTQE